MAQFMSEVKVKKKFEMQKQLKERTLFMLLRTSEGENIFFALTIYFSLYIRETVKNVLADFVR